MSIAFYISGHGYGHASRQIEIINALERRMPSAGIVIRTSAPKWLFDRTVRGPFRFFERECDPAVVQIDSLRLDEEATVEKAGAFYAGFDEMVAHDAAFLQEQQVSLVIADAPPLAAAAAARAGVPCVVASNFTWDWIYEGYGERFAAVAPHVLPCIRDAYRTAAEAWRLPMHGGFETFSQVADLPFVARQARADLHRADVLGMLKIDADLPLVLSSFSGYGISGLDLAALDCRDEWTVVITGDEPATPAPDGVTFVREADIYDAGLRYQDLVAACDIVVSKPGYGIISECVANETALLYTSRGRFREYDVLVREMPRFVRCAFIEQDTLFAGRWLEHLDALLVSPPPPERPPTNGADVAAEWIVERIRRGA